MKIRIAGIVNDSIVDGPGLRLTVFTQGCPHHCPECHNPESHDYQGGEEREIEEILSMARENILLDGITLSGGEPFVQAEACARIAEQARAFGLNVWCYTGYTFEKIIASQKPEWMNLLEHIDVLVDGPFLIEQKTLEAKFRGSANQRIIDVPASLMSGEICLTSIH